MHIECVSLNNYYTIVIQIDVQILESIFVHILVWVGYNIYLISFGKYEKMFAKSVKHNKDKGFKTSATWNAFVAQAGKTGIHRGPQVDEYGGYIESRD